VLHDRRGFAIMNKMIGWFGADVGILAILIAYIYLFPEGFILSIWMVALVAAVCIQPQNVFARLMSIQPMRYIGQISYGMYLLHMISMQVTRGIEKKFHLASPFILVIEIGLAVSAASISYWTFERWFLKLKERYTARPAGRREVAIIAEPVVAERM
jgi:peptidoglycan/LPS O-acetylase OafA/YrhL